MAFAASISVAQWLRDGDDLPLPLRNPRPRTARSRANRNAAGFLPIMPSLGQNFRLPLRIR